MNAKQSPIPARDALPPEVAKALDEVLWYVWQDEIENFAADEPAPDEEHIFRHIAAVDGWLHGHDATAEELVESFLSGGDKASARERVRRFRG